MVKRCKIGAYVTSAARAARHREIGHTELTDRPMPSPEPKAVQDYYPDDFAHCYGCGRLNAHGLHVRSVWDGDETVSRFTPRPEHMALPGFVYGGLLASLIDCHAMGILPACDCRTRGRPRDWRGLGAALRHSFAPRGLSQANAAGARARASRPRTLATERKSVVTVTVSANGVTTVRGEVVTVRVPASMARPGTQTAT